LGELDDGIAESALIFGELELHSRDTDGSCFAARPGAVVR
jgi:hypothetical protein